MTITFRIGGGTASGTTSVTPSVGAGATATDLSVLTVVAKPYNTVITTPTGWTKVTEQASGSNASGADTGSVLVAVYTAVGAAVGALPAIAGSGANSMGAVITTYATDLAASWDTSSFTTGTSASSTNYSATGATNIGLISGDWILSGTANNTTLGTLTATAIAATGATVGTLGSRANSTSANGDHLRRHVYDAPITAGSSSSAPTTSFTFTVVNEGATIFLRIRDTGSGLPELVTAYLI